eukprot:CAMPEP_0184677180 /NCGR_PEP_ID=MMETSP0308-20130426/88747_1 /TAXON_ID=38269 /ORGANISM="Gloeochaete witrockiana, Strain SAG 46.84" /LENGTH=186 /DNA_ID=CAMNT_0027125061 /DNA_START=881 /DNA_END=1438 /DNA_ORIENTATION=-
MRPSSLANGFAGLNDRSQFFGGGGGGGGDINRVPSTQHFQPISDSTSDGRRSQTPDSSTGDTASIAGSTGKKRQRSYSKQTLMKKAAREKLMARLPITKDAAEALHKARLVLNKLENRKLRNASETIMYLIERGNIDVSMVETENARHLSISSSAVSSSSSNHLHTQAMTSHHQRHSAVEIHQHQH